MNSSFPPQSGEGAAVQAGRSVHPAPHPCGRLHVTIYWATPGQSTPGQSTPGQSRLLTLPHQKFADWGEPGRGSTGWGIGSKMGR